MDRESLNLRRRETIQSVDTTRVEIHDDEVEPESGGSIPVRIYRGGPSPAPAVIYCHAGAFVLGNLDTDHRQCVELARRGGCTLISVDYRLAPEHPYPAALDDALAVLTWTAANAAELDVDPGRLAVAGSSAGAALAACLAQRAADGSAPPIVVQLLHRPVLDDRPMPSKDEFVATPGFNGPAVTMMWRHYLAGEPVQDAAAPARRSELAGVASALITARSWNRFATKPSITRCDSCGRASPPNYTYFPAPATGSLAAPGMGDQPTAVRASGRGVAASPYFRLTAPARAQPRRGSIELAEFTIRKNPRVGERLCMLDQLFG